MAIFTIDSENNIAAHAAVPLIWERRKRSQRKTSWRSSQLSARNEPAGLILGQSTSWTA